MVGINLLREGLDLPEVSLIAILDADKEGFLRSDTSMIQTIGRAARNEHGHVIMYADRVTESMQRAIDETNRRREIQKKYNEEHSIVPKTIYKEKRALIQLTKVADEGTVYNEKKLEKANKKELQRLSRELESAMRDAAKRLDFEQAAELRDRLIVVRGKIKLFLDDKELTESYTIPQTCDDWSVYEEIPVTRAHLEKGEHILKLQIVGNYINVDWLKML